MKIPRSVKEVHAFDAAEGHTLWAEAIKAEIDSFLKLDCFEFKEPEFKPPKDFQYAKLNMIFEVKHDGRRKARLVAGGHMVALHDMSACSTVVKGISV